jgi:alpha-D-xyloside xylohydrolase
MMKFTNGAWLLQKDVKIFRPAQVDLVETGPETVRILASTRRVQTRDDMHDAALLTFDFSSPMADVIGVKVTHFAGSKARLPQFALNPQPKPAVEVVEDGQSISLKSGKLSLQMAAKGPLALAFTAEGRVITTAKTNGFALAERENSGAFMLGQLSLGVGEYVYGMGERFTSFIKNGQAVDIWNRDGGTCTEQAYKNVPFYLTNRGYGVYVRYPGEVSFEVASENVSNVQFSVPGQELEYYVIYGPSPKEILEKYTALTGRPGLPPAWSFGLWLTTSFTTPYDEATVTSFIQGMAERDLPLDVFHFDCFWMKEYHWCNFIWDERVFPDPEGMLARLKQRGLKICLWVNPYIGQASELFAEAAQKGYLLKKANGEVWQTDLWQPGTGVVDFTNPEARHWYQEHMRRLLRMGADCFKTDFGERIPTDVMYWDGSDPERMHNYYALLYNQAVFEVMQEERGENEAVVFARSATAGCQQFPVHWGGDNESTFESMAESLRGGLSLGLSGFGFWSHDIGGFEGKPPAAVYKRWLAFGLLSSHSRLHGNSSYRVPWLFDDEAVDVLRKFTQLKLRLMPYLYQKAIEANQQGTPVMRAMWLEFPEDPTCAYLDRQYMLGDNLLVAPVFTDEEGLVQYYLPSGAWTNFFSGQVVNGPCWRAEKHDYLSVPLWVRANSVVALGKGGEHAAYDYAEDVTLQVYQLEEGEKIVDVPSTEGKAQTRFVVSRHGEQLEVKASGTSAAWQVLLVGVQSLAGVDGGQSDLTDQGVVVKASAGVESLKIYFA